MTWRSRSPDRWRSEREPWTRARCSWSPSSKPTSASQRRIWATSCRTSTAGGARSSAPSPTTVTRRCTRRCRRTRCCDLPSTSVRSPRAEAHSSSGSLTTTRCPRTCPMRSSKSSRKSTRRPARRTSIPNVTAAETMEGWGVDPRRLVYATVQDAMAHGARALNHTRVTDLIRDGGKVIGVRYRGPDGATSEARARVVVNATGPWSPEVGTMAGVKVDLRPAKGIHIVYPHRISNFSISAESIDGRDLLMVAHAGFTLLGTTDDDFYGDLDSVDVMEDEVEYLLQGFERVFPAIRNYRPVRTTTGVRPTLFKWRRYEDELSRRYEVIDHALRGVEGFVTIAGGKLSMYRLMAEETSDAVCRKLGHQV